MNVTRLPFVRGRFRPDPAKPDMEETSTQRARRKFAGGALEQAAAILGAMSASVFVIGLIVPYIAVFSGASMMSASALLTEAVSALCLSLVTTIASVTLKGLARREDDDGRFSNAGAVSRRAGD